MDPNHIQVEIERTKARIANWGICARQYPFAPDMSNSLNRDQEYLEYLYWKLGRETVATDCIRLDESERKE